MRFWTKSQVAADDDVVKRRSTGILAPAAGSRAVVVDSYQLTAVVYCLVVVAALQLEVVQEVTPEYAF